MTQKELTTKVAAQKRSANVSQSRDRKSDWSKYLAPGKTKKREDPDAIREALPFLRESTAPTTLSQIAISFGYYGYGRWFDSHTVKNNEFKDMVYTLYEALVADYSKAVVKGGRSGSGGRVLAPPYEYLAWKNKDKAFSVGEATRFFAR